MTRYEKTQELLEAAKAILPYLEASTAQRDEAIRRKSLPEAEITKIIEDARKEMHLPEPERLRRRASEIEAKDAAILRLREAIEKFATEGVDAG